MSDINTLLSMPKATIDTVTVEVAAPLTEQQLPGAENRVSDGFNHLFQQALDNVTNKQHIAQAQMSAVARKESDNVIGAVMAIQEAGLSFQFLLQVRNRVVEGYHELFNQQI